MSCEFGLSRCPRDVSAMPYVLLGAVVHTSPSHPSYSPHRYHSFSAPRMPISCLHLTYRLLDEMSWVNAWPRRPIRCRCGVARNSREYGYTHCRIDYGTSGTHVPGFRKQGLTKPIIIHMINSLEPLFASPESGSDLC